MDLNHTTVQGNKWHKLQNNLIQAKQLNKDTLITFGGAYSNHIAATASAAKAAGFKSIGIIRGDELAGLPEKWSNTLKGASTNGRIGLHLSPLWKQIGRFPLPSRKTHVKAEAATTDLTRPWSSPCNLISPACASWRSVSPTRSTGARANTRSMLKT
jgi:hypothetical protein